MSTGRTRILLVDDDPDMLRLLSGWAQRLDLDTLTAPDGRVAMEIIRSELPHVVVTDWNMPDVDGEQLCRWIRQQSLPHYIYAMMVSSRTGTPESVQALDAGADDFLSKPVTEIEFRARLRSGFRILELERRMADLARCCQLTGLINQRTFLQELDRFWQQSEIGQQPIASVFLDIDFFKRINDTYGHAKGDEVLRQIARLIQSHCRSQDLAARVGGEEFCILLPDTDHAGAFAWAEGLRKVIESHCIQMGNRELKITASMGVAQKLDDTLTPAELLDLSDQALLVAKQSGRNRVVSYQSINFSGNGIASRPDAVFQGEIARNAMSSIVASLKQDLLVGQAANYFLRFRISSAPVVDDNGKLVGILSEKDVMSTMLDPNWREARVEDVMKRNVVCYDQDTPVLVIYEFLCRVAIRGVVIVQNGVPVGIISRAALLRWFLNMIAATGATIDDVATYLDDPDVGPEHFLENMQAMSLELGRQADFMGESLAGKDEKVVPCVVGAVSRIQELVNDLLSHTRILHSLKPELSVDDNEAAGNWFPPGCIPAVLNQRPPT